jgi:PAS domain S-box-containing protein
MTEAKRHEEVRRKSEERFRHFAEASSDWLWEQDENLRFSYLSNAVNLKSGLPAEAHIGKTRQEVVKMGVTE